MVTTRRVDAIRTKPRLAIGLVLMVGSITTGLAQTGLSPSATESIARSLETGGDPSSTLRGLPESERNGDWHYLAALSALARGQRDRAEDHARRAATAGSARAAILARWLGVSDAQTGDATRAWRTNASYRAGLASIAWFEANRGAPFPALTRVSRVESFGPWPSTLAGIEATRRGAWLDASRGLLLTRLSGRDRDDGNESSLLLSFFSESRERPLDLARLRAELEATPDPTGAPISVWVIHTREAGAIDRIRTELSGVDRPVFVTFTDRAELLARPRFDLAGCRVLLDPRGKLRGFVPAGIPLVVGSSQLRDR